MNSQLRNHLSPGTRTRCSTGVSQKTACWCTTKTGLTWHSGAVPHERLGHGSRPWWLVDRMEKRSCGTNSSEFYLRFSQIGKQVQFLGPTNGPSTRSPKCVASKQKEECQQECVTSLGELVLEKILDQKIGRVYIPQHLQHHTCEVPRGLVFVVRWVRSLCQPLPGQPRLSARPSWKGVQVKH